MSCRTDSDRPESRLRTVLKLGVSLLAATSGCGEVARPAWSATAGESNDAGVPDGRGAAGQLSDRWGTEAGHGSASAEAGSGSADAGHDFAPVGAAEQPPRVGGGLFVVESRAMPSPLEPGKPPLCDLFGRRWSAPDALEGAPRLEADGLVDVSRDGRVWLFTRHAAHGSREEGPKFFVSHVPEAPVQLKLPSGYTLSSGGALSPDGHSLVVGTTSGASFAVLQRQSTGQYAEPDDGPFETLQALAGHSGTKLRAPSLAIGVERQSLFFTSALGGRAELSRARREGSSWELEFSTRFIFDLMEADASTRVSSVASDGQTAFVWDAQERRAMAVELPRDEVQPLERTQSIASSSPVFVGEGCRRLYALSEDGEAIVMTSEMVRFDDKGVPLP